MGRLLGFKLHGQNQTHCGGSIRVQRGEKMAVVFSNGLMMSASIGENFDGLAIEDNERTGRPSWTWKRKRDEAMVCSVGFRGCTDYC
ncbi:hypothetical protein PRUPE_3G140000 [Prunus persica]|uniref:Uncharacterized protein n=1 Tax=Prunus persica TaxID=3760 RepID=A0A251PZY4_PRUPE|nr:hypothetical protein PRUPE_3G140000 [Prunus persica]